MVERREQCGVEERPRVDDDRVEGVPGGVENGRELGLADRSACSGRRGAGSTATPVLSSVVMNDCSFSPSTSRPKR